MKVLVRIVALAAALIPTLLAGTSNAATDCISSPWYQSSSCEDAYYLCQYQYCNQAGPPSPGCLRSCNVDYHDCLSDGGGGYCPYYPIY